MATAPSNETPTESRYIFPAASPEKDRLAKQYMMLKSLHGWSTAVPDTVDVTRLENVIDIAAGTCLWALEFASMPEIRSKGDKIHIYACDIHPGFIPDTRITDELGIKTFVQDATEPFPSEYLGMFDLVQASFLALALTKDGWNSALANFNRLLKPGGILLLDEIDPIILTHQQHLQRRGDEDIAEYMTGSTWMHKANSLYTGFALKNEFIVGLPFHLPSMLEKSGFAVERREPWFAAFGPLCRVCKGAKGASLAEFEPDSVENLMHVLKHTVGSMAAKEDVQVLLEEFRAGFLKDGAIVNGAYFVAKKV